MGDVKSIGIVIYGITGVQHKSKSKDLSLKVMMHIQRKTIKEAWVLIVPDQ
jgi:hypothetical protein